MRWNDGRVSGDFQTRWLLSTWQSMQDKKYFTDCVFFSAPELNFKKDLKIYVTEVFRT